MRLTLDTKCRLCRSQGIKLFLKGSRCFSSKCPIEKKGAVPPGMHGDKRNKKSSDYALQLQAKQKAKRLYGIMETQFKNYYLQAKKLKGLIGDNLLTLLERRLDNLVYLAGLASSRSQAKQLVSHGHVSVNSQKMTVPSYLVKNGDIISLEDKFLAKVKDALRLQDKDFKIPSWIEIDRSKIVVKIVGTPDPAQTGNGIDINLIIEYYSR